MWESVTKSGVGVQNQGEKYDITFDAMTHWINLQYKFIPSLYDFINSKNLMSVSLFTIIDSYKLYIGF